MYFVVNSDFPLLTYNNPFGKLLCISRKTNEYTYLVRPISNDTKLKNLFVSDYKFSVVIGGEYYRLEDEYTSKDIDYESNVVLRKTEQLNICPCQVLGSDKNSALEYLSLIGTCRQCQNIETTEFEPNDRYKSKIRFSRGLLDDSITDEELKEIIEDGNFRQEMYFCMNIDNKSKYLHKFKKLLDDKPLEAVNCGVSEAIMEKAIVMDCEKFIDIAYELFPNHFGSPRIVNLSSRLHNSKYYYTIPRNQVNCNNYKPSKFDKNWLLNIHLDKKRNFGCVVCNSIHLKYRKTICLNCTDNEHDAYLASVYSY